MGNEPVWLGAASTKLRLVGRLPRRGVTRWKPALVLGMTLVVLAACSSGGDGRTSGPSVEPDEVTPGGKVVYGLEAETTGGWCLPKAFLVTPGIQVARAIYDTLTVPNADGEYVPYLARSVEPNKDYTEWTIELREGVTFHDGSPLTAEVVKNNLDAYAGRYPGLEVTLFEFVFANLETIEATGPLTVTITTKTSWASFPSFLYMNGRVGIMAQSQLDSKQCNSDMVGTGPFVKREWKVNDRFRAEKNLDYWQEDPNGIPLPYLDEIEFRALEEDTARYRSLRSGDYSLMHTSTARDIESIRKKTESGKLNNVESDEYAEVNHVMLNVSAPPFDSLTARMALAYAVDREELNQLNSNGIRRVASGPFAPGNMGYLEDPGFPEHDLERAKELVAQYEKESGQPFRMAFAYTPDSATTELVQILQQLARRAGIEVTLTPLGDQSSYVVTAVGGKYQAMVFRNYPGGDPDLNYVWWYGTMGDAGALNIVNFGKFNDPEINRLLDEGRAESNPEKRRVIYEDLNRVFGEQLYDIWGWWTLWSIASQPDVFGVMGPPLPDGGGDPFPGLGAGHPVLGLWVAR